MRISLLFSSILTLFLCQYSEAKENQDLKKMNLLREKMLEIYPKIIIDGQNSFWDTIPTIQDKKRELIKKSLDISQISIIPNSKNLKIMIQTRTIPSIDDFVYYIFLDISGDSKFDFGIGISKGNQHKLEIYFEEKPAILKILKAIKVKVKVKDVIELEIPYHSLIKEVPTHSRGHHSYFINSQKIKEFIRVRAISYQYQGSTRNQIDYGLAIASYIIDTPITQETLSPPNKSQVISAPLKGTSYISQGPNESYSHQNIYAYDFVKIDEGLNLFNFYEDPTPLNYKNNYSYEKEIFSPIVGKVLISEDHHLDLLPAEAGKKSNHNQIIIKTIEGNKFHLLHLRENSLGVKEDQQVQKGQILGKIGNSGFSTNPHLHLHMKDRNGKSRALYLKDIKVKINPGKDPWSFNKSIWKIKSGFYIEKLDQHQP